MPATAVWLGPLFCGMGWQRLGQRPKGFIDGDRVAKHFGHVGIEHQHITARLLKFRLQSGLK